MRSSESFFDVWKKASFGWLTHNRKVTIINNFKIIGLFIGYATFHNLENSGLGIAIKLIGFIIVFHLFKKWFMPKVTLKSVLDDMKAEHKPLEEASIRDLNKWDENFYQVFMPDLRRGKK